MARVAMVLLVFVGTACWPFSDDEGLAPMEVKGKGRVEILRGDEVIHVDGSEMLEPGDVIRTFKDSSASMRLEGEREADLASSSEAAILTGSALESLRGSLLVRAGDRSRVEFGNVDAVTPNGIFRVDNGFGTARAGVYDGSLDLSTSAQPRLGVSELHEAAVAASHLPSRDRPYRLDPQDRWDQIYLEDVLELDRELTLLGEGLATQLDRARAPLSFFRSLARGGSVRYVRPYLRRPVPDLLIGFTIARNAKDRPTPRAFRTAFSLFDEGARWGIVATLLDVPSRPLIAQLERIITGRVASSGGPDESPIFASGDDASFDPPSDVRRPSDDRDPRDPREPDDPDPTRSPPSPPPCDNPVDCLTDQLPTPAPTTGTP